MRKKWSGYVIQADEIVECLRHSPFCSKSDGLRHTLQTVRSAAHTTALRTPTFFRESPTARGHTAVRFFDRLSLLLPP